MSAPPKERQEGKAVDASGGSVVDPTANVLQLVTAEAKRTDDLRIADARRLDDLRAADTKRTDDLREAEARRVNEIMTVRAGYDTLLKEAEAKRIDANRAGDTNAITTLAAQVSATAAALATAADRVTAPIIERIAALEKANWENQGRSPGATAQSDAVVKGLSDLAAVVAGLDKSRSEGAGKSEGQARTQQSVGNVIGYVVGAAGVGVAAAKLLFP